MIATFFKKIWKYFLNKLEIRLTSSKTKPIFNILKPFYYFMKISGCACFTVDLTSAKQIIKVTIIDYSIFASYLSLYLYLMSFSICFKDCIHDFQEESDIELFGFHLIYVIEYMISVISFLLLFLFRSKRVKILTIFNEIDNLFTLLGSNVNVGLKWIIMYSYLIIQLMWFIIILITSYKFERAILILNYWTSNINFFITFGSVVLLCFGIFSKLNTLNDNITEILKFKNLPICENSITILVSAHDNICEAITLINFCFGFQFLLFFCLSFIKTLFVFFELFQDIDTISITESLSLVNLTNYSNSYTLEIIFISHRITNMVTVKYLTI